MVTRCLSRHVALPAALLIALLAGGCTGIGHISTSDPYGKLGQAQALVAEDRLLLAEDVIGQAMERFRQSGDIEGMAEAHHAYGNLYKNDLYQNGRWTSQFQKLGTWDGSYQKSIDQFFAAGKLFAEAGDEIGVVKSLIGTGNAHGLRGEREAACEHYLEARRRHRQAIDSGQPLRDHPILTGYPDIETLLQGFIADANCEQG